MNAADLPNTEAPTTRTPFAYRHPGAAPGWHLPFLVLFLVALAGRMALTLSGKELPVAWRWADGVFWATAGLTSVAGLARWMPVQNALAAGAMLAAFAALVELVGTQTGFPFGSYAYEDRLGVKVSGVFSWPILAYWVAVLLSSRGVARMILRPWRRGLHYGFWVIILGAGLATWMALGAEVFFVKVAEYKQWTGNVPWTWHQVPWTFFVAWPVISVLALAFVSPWLIMKPPVKAPTEGHPLVVWLLLAALFLLGCVLKQCWMAVIAMGLAIPVVWILAVRGRRLPVAPAPGDR